MTATHAEPQFYDVAASAFEQQLLALESHRFHCISASQLLSGNPPDAKSFVLSFDDGTKDHLEVVAPILKQHHCGGTFFVPTARLNTANSLSDQDVRDLASQGHTIGLHSHEHRPMDRMPATELSEQMRVSKERIQRIIGTAPQLFAPVGGFMSPAVREAAVREGVRLIRTMRWGYNRHLDLLNVQCIPINSRTTASQFEKFLNFRNLGLTYSLKQAVKSVLPMAVYQKLRDKLYSHA